MLLAREFIGFLSRQLVRKLTPHTFEVADPNFAAELIGGMIQEELMVEDRLNDEVREVLEQYSEYMRRENISYQEMFKMIKNKLVRERKVIL